MRNRTENQITLLFIRHGSTKANREGRYLGRTDEGLSEEGRIKLQEYKSRNFYPGVQCLFTGPMIRCVQTGKLLYPDLQGILIPEWTEMDFGEFEGKNYEELRGDRRYQAWIDSNGALPFPGGESREDFVRRCDRGFQRMLALLREGQETAGAVVHGGTIMALLSLYCGGEYFDYQVENGRGYLCTVKVLCGGAEVSVSCKF